MNYTHNVNCGDFGLMHPESFLHCPTMLSNIFTIFDFFFTVVVGMIIVYYYKYHQTYLHVYVGFVKFLGHI